MYSQGQIGSCYSIAFCGEHAIASLNLMDITQMGQCNTVMSHTIDSKHFEVITPCVAVLNLQIIFADCYILF